MKATCARACAVLSLVLSLVGCAYRVVTGPLEPLPELSQSGSAQVADDGSITHSIDRLRIRLRPMSDEELNRQFPELSQGGEHSTNPYTYGNWKPRGAERTPRRFAVFRLEVENYSFPKVLVDPLRAEIHAQNGRVYRAYSFQVLREYYYPYNRAYAGNPNAGFKARTSALNRTLYPEEQMVFAGQSTQGFLVFPALHDDVEQVSVRVEHIALRFDYRDVPTETADLVFNFQREVWREK